MNVRKHITSALGGAMTRRAFVAGLPAVGASLAVPTTAAVAAEQPADRVRRLSEELSEALGDPNLHPAFFPRLVVTADGVLYTHNDPESRIADAAGLIAEALAEQHPGWRFPRISRDTIPAIDRHGNARPTREAILVYASEERHGAEEAQWWVRYAE
jgi:hypothetical protein